MTEICKFLKVEHGTGTLEEEDCVLVEECKEYDTALSGYIIVCARKIYQKFLRGLQRI